VINTLAGGGSFLTVPVLVLFGLPGNLANGTNRVGVLLQAFVAAAHFRRSAFLVPRDVLPILWPIAAGTVLGALFVNQLSDAVFEKTFGITMVVLWLGTLRVPPAQAAYPPPSSWRHLAYFAVGIYGGAFQAGVGLLLVMMLQRSGLDLLRANVLKVAVNFCFTFLAVPVFILNNRVAWVPALALGAGYALGGEVGARLAIGKGEKLLRPAFGLAVVVLAGHMLGLY